AFGNSNHHIFGISLHVSNVNRFAIKQNTSGDRAASCFDGLTLHILVVLARSAMTCDVQKGRALRTTDRRHISFAKSGNGFHEGLQYSLKIESRAADDFQYVSGGGLLLQRFSQFAKKTCVLD